VWDTSPPVTKVMLNSKLTLEHQDFVTKTISEMVEVGAAPALHIGGIPTVVSPLGVAISQPSFGVLSLNMRYVINYLVNRVFKFERIPIIADMADTWDYSMAYDLASGFYHGALATYTKTLCALLVSNGKDNIINATAYPFGLSTTPLVFSKAISRVGDVLEG